MALKYRYTWVDIRGREVADDWPKAHGASCGSDDLERIRFGLYNEREHVFRALAVEEESGPIGLVYTGAIGLGYRCSGGTNERHKCDQWALRHLVIYSVLEHPEDILDVDYLLGWEVD